MSFHFARQSYPAPPSKPSFNQRFPNGPSGNKHKIGILAFGSLRTYPGRIGDYKIDGIGTETPFRVEYARRSRARGGAPTLAPHEKGRPVNAEVFVLPAKMPFDEARNLLWRRERNKEGSDETYSVGIGPNHVLVREWRDCPQVETVLYTDFNSSGKEDLTVQQLADAACQSVKLADPGRDGITYLENAIDAGVETPLTAAYRAEILRRTGAATLAQARELLKQQSPV